MSTESKDKKKRLLLLILLLLLAVGGGIVIRVLFRHEGKRNVPSPPETNVSPLVSTNGAPGRAESKKADQKRKDNVSLKSPDNGTKAESSPKFSSVAPKDSNDKTSRKDKKDDKATAKDKDKSKVSKSGTPASPPYEEIRLSEDAKKGKTNIQYFIEFQQTNSRTVWVKKNITNASSSGTSVRGSDSHTVYEAITNY